MATATIKEILFSQGKIFVLMLLQLKYGGVLKTRGDNL